MSDAINRMFTLPVMHVIRRWIHEVVACPSRVPTRPPTTHLAAHSSTDSADCHLKKRNTLIHTA